MNEHAALGCRVKDVALCDVQSSRVRRSGIGSHQRTYARVVSQIKLGSRSEIKSTHEVRNFPI